MLCRGGCWHLHNHWCLISVPRSKLLTSRLATTTQKPRNSGYASGHARCSVARLVSRRTMEGLLGDTTPQ